eukprot:5438816-Prymnesium_polylepis.1
MGADSDAPRVRGRCDSEFDDQVAARAHGIGVGGSSGGRGGGGGGGGGGIGGGPWRRRRIVTEGHAMAGDDSLADRRPVVSQQHAQRVARRQHGAAGDGWHELGEAERLRSDRRAHVVPQVIADALQWREANSRGSERGSGWWWWCCCCCGCGRDRQAS